MIKNELKELKQHLKDLQNILQEKDDLSTKSLISNSIKFLINLIFRYIIEYNG
jgi:hypothetical protein